jgi:hypothetical protein
MAVAADKAAGKVVVAGKAIVVAGKAVDRAAADKTLAEASRAGRRQMAAPRRRPLRIAGRTSRKRLIGFRRIGRQLVP